MVECNQMLTCGAQCAGMQRCFVLPIPGCICLPCVSYIKSSPLYGKVVSDYPALLHICTVCVSVKLVFSTFGLKGQALFPLKLLKTKLHFDILQTWDLAWQHRRCLCLWHVWTTSRCRFESAEIVFRDLWSYAQRLGSRTGAAFAILPEVQKQLPLLPST